MLTLDRPRHPPDTLSPLILYFAVLAFFILLAVFFSVSETAFMAVNRDRLKFQAKAGDKRAEAIRQLIANPDRLLGVILFGVTVTEIAAAGLLTFIITTWASKKHSEIASLAGSILFSVVVLIFCELTPKIIAATHADMIARHLLLPIKVTIWLLSPFARLAARAANWLVRLIGMSAGPDPLHSSMSESEIRAMIAGTEEPVLAEEKKEMLHNVFEIGAMQVREVMIPRGEVTAVDIDDPISKILEVVKRTNYSRIPVYRQNFDNPVGILYVKDLLQYIQIPVDINLKALLHSVHFVPDSARLDIVLRQLQSMHLHMAVVVDEFGGVEGIVTLENLLEEIVGEIRDEHDTEMESIRELGPRLYSTAGNLPVKDFNRFFRDKIPETQEYTTVAGFIEALTGRLLGEGETIRYKNLMFSIEKAEGFRITSIRVRTSTPKDPAGRRRSVESVKS
jgi:putative hemolysin